MMQLVNSIHQTESKIAHYQYFQALQRANFNFSQREQKSAWRRRDSEDLVNHVEKIRKND